MEQIAHNETEVAIFESDASNMCNKTNMKDVNKIFTDLKKVTEDLHAEVPNLGNDLYLLSWLKARDMDVMQAEQLIRQAMKWRSTEKTREILSAEVPTEVLQMFVTSAPKSFCRDGKMIEFLTGAQPEFTKMLKRYGPDPFLRLLAEESDAVDARLLAWSQKRLDESTDKEITPESYPGFIHVFNAKNIAIKQATSLRGIQFLRELAHINKNYCPFVVSKFIIINCPKFAVYLIKIFKPLFETKFSKFEVYDGDETLWKEALLKYVHPDFLPIPYGGNMNISESTYFRFQDIPFP